jgi:hypothetical protein
MMMSLSKKKMGGYGWARFGLMATVIGIFVSVFQIAGAFDIPTGNEDVKVRWDNTFRYNYGVRVHNQDQAILNNPNMDDGNRNFGKGTVTNRLDILSEFDLVYKEAYGFRVSGAGWYDQRYNDPLDDHTTGVTSNKRAGGPFGLSERTKKSSMGPDAELLDAFVFSKFNLGSVPGSIKVGRHTLYWGEALFFGGHINGISYSQMPLDIGKGFATPGTEAKELFRPLFNVSAQLQLTNTLSLSGQYFLQFEPDKLPEAGTYLGNSDVLARGGESLILPGYYVGSTDPLVYLRHANDIEPDGTKDWGVALHWNPNWLDGKIGLYYRNFSDKLPQVHINLATQEYFASYAQNIHLYGLSFTRQILGVSVGAEYSYRENMPLQSQSILILPGVFAPAAPDKGDTLGARGNTHHALINVMGMMAKHGVFWDSMTWMAEFTYCRLQSVTSGESLSLGADSYRNIDRFTKDSGGIALSVTPTWFNVFPAIDLSMPINYNRGLFGTSPLLLGDAENAGSMGLGLALDILQKYNLSLMYNKYFGNYDTSGGAFSAGRGSTASLADRDWVSLTFKFML